MRRVGAVIFETVKVLVTLAAVFATIRLLFLHTEGTGVGRRGFGVNNREGTVRVIVELLVGVTVLFRMLVT